MDFQVLIHKTGEVYPSKYSDGKHEIFVNRAKAMEDKYNVSLPKIKKILIGDSENPINEIHFEGGLVLFDEEASVYPRTKNENKKRIDDWLAEKERNDKTGVYYDKRNDNNQRNRNGIPI